MSTELLMLFNHLILCGSCLFLPSIFPSIRMFSNEKALHIRWSKYWASATVLPMNQLSSVQSLSHVQLFATLWTTVHQASLSITNSQSLFKLISIESVMPFNHHILCRPLLLLPSVLPASGSFQMSQLFTSGSQSLSNEHSRLISRMDWLDILAASLKGLSRVFLTPQFKGSILWCSAFFLVQLSHLYKDYWKCHSLDEIDLCWQSNVSAF